MKYRVIGSNKDTGARQSMEFEAESKAAAERKALNAGMIVNRVEDITDGTARHAIVEGGSGKSGSGAGGLIKLIIVIGILVLAWYLFGARIKGMLHR